MDPREEKERQRAEEARKQQAELERKQRSCFVVGVMKSGNPFQIQLGEGDLKSFAERIRKALQKGDVEIIEGAAFVVVRWSDMESCVVMTEAEMERRQRMQAMQGGGGRH